LTDSIAESRKCLENLKNLIFDEEVPTDIRRHSAENTESKDKMIRGLILQLEQSKRDRLANEIELTMYRKNHSLNPTNFAAKPLKEIILEILHEEIKNTK